jgi:type I restriction enzyme S subunit
MKKNIASPEIIKKSVYPIDWKEVKIKDIGKLSSGTTPLRSNDRFHKNGNIFWVKTTDLNNSVILETEEKITEAALNETSLRIFPKETVLVAMYGGFNQIGRTGILGIEATINQALTAIVVDKSQTDPTFLLNWLNANVGVWKNLAGSSRKDPNITSKDVGDFPFVQAPLPEQKAIASVLNLMDSAINKTNQLIAQKEFQKKGLMQQLLTGKKRLRGFSGRWSRVELKDCFTFVKTHSISRDGLTTEISPNSIFCIHYGDIHALYEGSYLDFSSQEKIPKIIDPNFVLQQMDVLKEGDIILADASEDYNGVGEAVEVKNIGSEIAVGGLHTIVLRGTNNVTANGFRAYLFSSEKIRNELRRMATGSSVYSVTKGTLEDLVLLLPSLDEQIAITQILQTADREIQLLKSKAERLKEQKKGMMQVLLTGKKRLRIKV